MIGAFKLAFRYILFNRVKSIILIACICLTTLLPIGTKILLDQFNETLLSRARETPVVIGAKGSPLDLTLHALYWKATPPGSVSVEESNRILETELARVIPVHARFTARRFPIVGTTIDYLEFRELKFRSGGSFAILGECVIGAAVAQQLGLDVGDTLLSDRENVIDIAGLYPLKMKIVGVLESNNSADDQAVFVDLNTVWVIAGLGHGHEDVAAADPTKILRQTDQNIVASAAVLPFTEVTDANINSFHFHGDPNQFPLTSIIAVPLDMKSRTILEGQYSSGQTPFQFVIPTERIEELMNFVFRVKAFFDANAIMVGISTLLLMLLVVMLSLRLRQREMETMFRMGCSRGTIIMLQVWELTIIVGVAMLLLTGILWGLNLFGAALIEAIFL